MTINGLIFLLKSFSYAFMALGLLMEKVWLTTNRKMEITQNFPNQIFTFLGQNAENMHFKTAFTDSLYFFFLTLNFIQVHCVLSVRSYAPSLMNGHKGIGSITCCLNISFVATHVLWQYMMPWKPALASHLMPHMKTKYPHLKNNTKLCLSHWTCLDIFLSKLSPQCIAKFDFTMATFFKDINHPNYLDLNFKDQSTNKIKDSL